MATAEERNLKSHIGRVVQAIEPDLLPGEVSNLVDEMDSSLAAYASQAKRDTHEKKGHDELKVHRQNTLRKSIAIALSSMRNAIERQSPASRAELRLRGHISHALEAARIELTDEEKSKIEDRMIRLLDDYVHATREKKHEVYRRGEQEVLSIIDPPALSAGASGY